MKKMILSLMSAMLSCATFAANCVSVQQTGTDYANHKITIVLTRSGCTGDATNHRNTVWVFVDYREVSSNVWTRATISTSSAGTVVNSGNSKGAWIYGANGTQSVTLTLSGMPAKYDWCAFATDYPPNVAAAGGVYTFKGTPPFVLQPATGAAQTVTQTTLAATALTVASVSIMDATGCTGTFCPYTGSDLYMDATHICQQRSSGAKNWEAWIKDTRDNELYRIVQMPDDYWWMAQDLNYASNYHLSCTDDWGRGFKMYYQGAIYPLSGEVQSNCPAGWIIPSEPTWRNMYTKAGGIAALCLSGSYSSAYCAAKEDNWSFRIVGDCCSICWGNGNNEGIHAHPGHYWVPSSVRWIRVDRTDWGDVYAGVGGRSNSVRCMRK